MLLRLLLAIDPPALLRRVSRLIQDPGVLIVATGAPGDSLWERVGGGSCDLVITCHGARPTSTASTVTALRALPERPEIIVLRHHDDPRDRAALLSAGALAVLSPDLADAELRAAFSSLIERRRESLETGLRSDAASDRYQLADFASKSPAMRALLKVARKVAAAESSLLILGETGVGKEWLARAIHAEGPRARAPFLAINCAALPESLLESELFGHERGAFTGAVRSHRGHFESAHRGTIFLDEIGDMPAHLQAKLLRVLEERTIQRLGAEEPIAIDVRLMAATNQNLDEAMARRTFRRDLFYRLGVVTLTIPPLRERREDIPDLVDSYLDKFRPQPGRGPLRIGPVALAALTEYQWPGNVRELINVVERTVLLAASDEVTMDDLPRAIAGAGSAAAESPLADSSTPGDPFLAPPYSEARRRALESFELRYLDHHLRAAGGRVGETARRIGIDPRTLYNRMQALGLRKEGYRA